MDEIDLLHLRVSQLEASNRQLTEQISQDQSIIRSLQERDAVYTSLEKWLDNRKAGYARAIIDNGFGGFSVKLEQDDENMAYVTDYPLVSTILTALQRLPLIPDNVASTKTNGGGNGQVTD